jgi:hypothetical protein
MEQTINVSLFELQVDRDASAQLRETARWAKFLGIVGFIMCGLCAIGGIVAGILIGSFVKSSPYGSGPYSTAGYSAVLGFVYVGMAILYFFPCLFLFNFGSRMTKALQTNDQERLTLSLKNLKACLRYMGILAIIGLGFTLLFFVLAVIGNVLGR